MEITSTNATPEPVSDLSTVLKAYHDAAAGLDGKLVLFATVPDIKKTVVRHFKVGEHEKMAAAARELSATHNVYCAPVVYKPTLKSGKRGKVTDIVAVLGLGFDDDADTGKTVAEPPSSLQPTFAIQSSPGNRNLIFLFDRPLSPEVARAASAELYALLGGDHGGKDIDHVWRLPETLNHPTKVKIARGRSVQPQPVRLTGGTRKPQGWSLRAINASKLADVPPSVDDDASDDDGNDITTTPDAALALRDQLLDTLPDSLRLLVLSPTGSRGDRSDHFWHVTNELLEQGCNDRMIRALAEVSPFGSKWHGDRDKLREQILKARQKWRKAGSKLSPKSSAHALQELLKESGLVLLKGRCVVATWDENPASKSTTLRPLAMDAFRLFHSDKKLPSLDKRGRLRSIPISVAFEAQATRYEGITFLPGKPREVGKYLNLWRGWPFEPNPGDWSRMKRHLLEVVANGNREHADYILKWLAYAVQNPDRPSGVVLVLKSGQGTGKGILGRAFVRIFGDHGFHVTTRNDMFGDFTHPKLAQTCALFGDEVVWPGDFGAKARFKTMITEEVLAHNQKGVPQFDTPNSLSIILASNEDWVVPAEHDDRRCAVFNVSNRYGRRADGSNEDFRKAYFDPLIAEMEGEVGLAAMLYDLLHVPLGDWKPWHDIPRTDALLAQKMESADWIDRTVFDIAMRGEMPGSSMDNPAFSATANSKNVPTGFWNNFRNGAPKSAQLVSDTKLSLELSKRYGFVTGDRGRWKRQRGVIAPPLLDLRRKLDERFGGTLSWDGQAEWTVYPEDFDNDVIGNGKAVKVPSLQD